MKAFLLFVISPLLAATVLFSDSFQSAGSMASKKSILVFSATRGFRHESIEDGIKAIGKIASRNGWKMVATEDSAVFNEKNLKKFNTIVLLNTTGNVFGQNEEAALQQFVRKGGGIAGVHAAADCEYEWPWYNQLIGGYFESHPAIQSATMKVKEQHVSTEHLGASWVHKDEWYNYKSVSPSIKVLLELDETTYEGGKMGNNHPIAWYQEFDGGRVFYTGLGHTSEAYQDEKFLIHLENGIRYTMK